MRKKRVIGTFVDKSAYGVDVDYRVVEKVGLEFYSTHRGWTLSMNSKEMDAIVVHRAVLSGAYKSCNEQVIDATPLLLESPTGRKFKFFPATDFKDVGTLCTVEADGDDIFYSSMNETTIAVDAMYRKMINEE